MHTSMKIEKPGAVEVTLTVTMSLSDWIALRSQLCRNWPSWKLSEAINGLVDKLMAHVDYEHMAQDGFRPLTEGYQPGSQILQKGFVPTAVGATPAKPPSGGSGVAKPAQASSGSSTPKN